MHKAHKVSGAMLYKSKSSEKEMITKASLCWNKVNTAQEVIKIQQD